MNIGVDIDGVLTDLERMALDFGTKMCVEENIPIERPATRSASLRCANIIAPGRVTR